MSVRLPVLFYFHNVVGITLFACCERMQRVLLILLQLARSVNGSLIVSDVLADSTPIFEPFFASLVRPTPPPIQYTGPEVL